MDDASRLLVPATMAQGRALSMDHLDPKEPVILKELLPAELKDLLVGWGFKSFRTEQLLKWIYVRNATDFQEMSDISKADRAALAKSCEIGSLRVLERTLASDGTQKLLLELQDGLSIETVIIPEEDHFTQCVSTQVGCNMGCVFCRTSSLRLRRHLRTWEIVDQVVTGRRLMEQGRIRNVVLMGMGEPLANYDAVLKAIKIMLEPKALDLSKRRITLSTCGLIPELKKLVSEGLGIGLAISLNATTEAQRNMLMPINRKYSLAHLLETCRDLPLGPRNRITFEYVLLDRVNDSLEDARRLVKLLKGIRCKVNLIPHNSYPGSPFKRPPDDRILAFQKVLSEHGLTCPIRWSHGSEIWAACGQLAGKDLPCGT